MPLDYPWSFPLPRTHTGLLLGNAVLGAMVWGEGNVLRITVGRADLWDHRNGKPWTDEMSFRTIRRLLEAGDETELRRIFSDAPAAPGNPRRPSLLPIGRVEIVLPESATLTRGTLHTSEGRATVHARTADGREHAIELDLSLEAPVLAVRVADELGGFSLRHVTSWDPVGEYLKSISFAEPEVFDRDGTRGWVQRRPAPGDGPVAVGYTTRGREAFVAVRIADDADSAVTRTLELLEATAAAGTAALREANTRWWSDYWRRVPTIDLPNARLRFLYEYGMYKFAGLTHPAGVAAGLQGPWLEEYQMPPWSADYHFNINVQMCYQPAYAAGLTEHLLPLFRLIESWLPKLQANARKFVGIDDGYVLPHAVDDRGDIIGNFWTGTIDHACTAWVGKMMYDYYLHTGDAGFLKKTAYPFMVGAMRVYEEMLERGTVAAKEEPRVAAPMFEGKPISSAAVFAVPKKIAVSGTLFPIFFHPGTKNLTVIVADTANTKPVEDLRKVFGYLVQVKPADAGLVRQLIDTHYADAPPAGGSPATSGATRPARADTLSLPVSVSPEYRGAAMNAWGRNASFQLAAIHWLAAALEDAAATLGERPRPIWSEIRAKLPKATLVGDAGKERLGLWEGTDLEESHRHHSHLAGITPFDVIDPAADEWRDVVARSINHWIYRGMGLWSGWCMPWAAMLHTRAGNPEMAELVLEIWERVFTNEGHGTLHDCNYPGLTLLGIGPRSNSNREIMQMDAGMGATTAVLDLLVHTRAGTAYVFPGCPPTWKDAAFTGVHLPGGFVLSATRRAGVTERVRLHSHRGGVLRLANPWPASGALVLRQNAPGRKTEGAVIEIETDAGEEIELLPATE